jgi:hypothetical protein
MVGGRCSTRATLHGQFEPACSAVVVQIGHGWAQWLVEGQAERACLRVGGKPCVKVQLCVTMACPAFACRICSTTAA